MSKDQTDVSHIDKGEINEPVAIRYDFDGHGYLYMDAGSGSDWASRVKDCEFLYTHPMRELNEPIAWMHTNSKQIFKTEKPNEFDLPLFTPLYAHPMRELTDDEIQRIWYEEVTKYQDIEDYDIHVFAKAILKKASEK
jgi:hypothetical protein